MQQVNALMQEECANNYDFYKDYDDMMRECKMWGYKSSDIATKA